MQVVDNFLICTLGLNMITVYEVKPNGFWGRTREIDPAQGIGYGWVYDKPTAPICKWENAVWVPYDEELPNQVNVSQEQEAQTIGQQANELLSASDWTAIPSVGDPLQSNPYLINQEEFIAWRSQVRAIALNPSYNSVIPTEPTEVWSEPT